MQPTQLSLLKRLGQHDEPAWSSADALYRPLIGSWLSRFGVPLDQKDDIEQSVLMTLSREIVRFEHNGQIGAFRKWLRTVTFNCVREFYRRERRRVTATGGTKFLRKLEAVVDESDDLSQNLDRMHDQFVVLQLVREITHEFSSQTMELFQKHVVLGQAVTEVAAEMSVSRWAVYQAKSRILRRLRERLGPWANEFDSL